MSTHKSSKPSVIVQQDEKYETIRSVDCAMKVVMNLVLNGHPLQKSKHF